MALSVENGPVYTTYKIPLIGGSDDQWQDNTWIVQHLRHIADKIEETQLRIYTMGVEMDAAYKSPRLVIKGFMPNEWQKIETPEFAAEKLEDYGKLITEIMGIEDFNNFGGADRLCEKYNVTRQEFNWFVHQYKFGGGQDILTALMFAQKNSEKA